MCYNNTWSFLRSEKLRTRRKPVRDVTQEKISHDVVFEVRAAGRSIPSDLMSSFSAKFRHFQVQFEPSWEPIKRFKRCKGAIKTLKRWYEREACEKSSIARIRVLSRETRLEVLSLRFCRTRPFGNLVSLRMCTSRWWCLDRNGA